MTSKQNHSQITYRTNQPMNELIKIRCPFCSSTLSVAPVPGIESKSVTCPVCKRKSPFTDFKQPDTQEKPTDYEGNGSNSSASNTSGHTPSAGGSNFAGQICLLKSGETFPLKPGRNVIGRKASSSKATVQIPTGESKRVSREHLVINANSIPGQGYMYTISLFKEHVNKTLVNGTELLPGEELPLKHGCRIDLPDVQLRFEIVDEEGTDF